MEKVLSVFELNASVRETLVSDARFKDVRVRGEVSNLTKHSSGHYYFSLKDESSQIRCTLWRGNRRRIDLELEENMRVVATGSVDIYVQRGAYQFNVTGVREEGLGDLYLAFMRMKERLEEEGLFDPLRKRALPRYPRRVGVITSPTGAALRDILRVTGRRFPADIVIGPALVQGGAAKHSIAKNIRVLDTMGLDVIIIGRGGGSLEDLWAFNEEEVARAIHECSTPIVSAVGHETDFTIADFVADVRAATPSAAAELVVPDSAEELAFTKNLSRRASRAMDSSLLMGQRHVQALSNVISPQRAMMSMDARSTRLTSIGDRGSHIMERDLNLRTSTVDGLGGRLQAVSPRATLERGYCILMDDSGRPIVSVTSVSPGDEVGMELKDGFIRGEVREVS